MTNTELLHAFQEITHRLGVEVRWDPGEYSGGLCRLGGHWMFIINPALPLQSQVEILRKGLASFDLSAMFLLPAVREYISPSSLSRE